MHRQRIGNILLAGLFIPVICVAQTQKDSIVSLDEITIRAYPSNPSLLRSASSVSYLDAEHIRDLATQTMVPAMNSEAGVRMEERSPGSYRLSIRGSLLRSPFGIRNIKVYLDDFPLTDAGGNTYLNLVPASTIHSIQIIKGPEGSVFGANTGGVVVLGSEIRTDSVQMMASLATGSFGLLDQKAALYKVWNHYSLQMDQSFQMANGYRQNSALQRISLRAIQKLRYKNGNIRLLLMGTNLHYETPGGLTLTQTQEDPRQARPATSSLPGATEQKAGIYNSTFFGGISNHIFINSHIRHEFVLYGSATDFKNPFITNYEVRKENTFGIRTFFELHGNKNNLNWNWDIGADWQRTGAEVENSGNIAGSKGELEASDDLNAKQGFLFSQISVFMQRIRFEGAVSINRNRTEFRSNFPVPDDSFTGNSLQPVILPRLGISYRFFPQLVWRVSASKGYSPPTFAELRPSGNIINPDLDAEYGWNYETGIRFISGDNRFYADLVLFRFGLKNAIVRRTNSDETEYYVNAGSTQQNGLEFQISFDLINT
jgi:iron complex outermembrane receptor protein